MQIVMRLGFATIRTAYDYKGSLHLALRTVLFRPCMYNVRLGHSADLTAVVVAVDKHPIITNIRRMNMTSSPPMHDTGLELQHGLSWWGATRREQGQGITQTGYCIDYQYPCTTPCIAGTTGSPVRFYIRLIDRHRAHLGPSPAPLRHTL